MRFQWGRASSIEGLGPTLPSSLGLPVCLGFGGCLV